MIKKIAIGVLILLVVLQFVRPPRNLAEGISENDISKTYGIPDAVHSIFVEKCYDCHSNNTIYPWYTNVQPVGWWMNYHIEDGKKHLDFSEFKTYTDKKANHKLEELSEMVVDGLMPIESYLWMHRNAKVSSEEVSMINNWIQSLGVKIKE
ncbi:MAG: heme-binding domain-containing protein [Cyclobacteriaceae bacterium]|nr:heme-binding domain-containing protein [Cyclobacteriaceae bacterium]